MTYMKIFFNINIIAFHHQSIYIVHCTKSSKMFVAIINENYIFQEYWKRFGK